LGVQATIVPDDPVEESEPYPFDEVPPTTSASNDGEEELKFGLHPDDPANFLKLCAALRILMQHVLSETDIDNADSLLREYATESIKVCIQLLWIVVFANLHLIYSFTDQMPLNQITTMQHILQPLCATLGRFMISGHFFLSNSIKFSNPSRQITIQEGNSRQPSSLNSTG